MELNQTQAEGLQREFKVVVSAGEVEERLLVRLAEISKSATMPGFRPGKVPVPLLRKKYGGSLRGEILEKTVADSWQRALSDTGLRPAMEPKIEIVSFEEGGDLEYKLTIELVPEFEPMAFDTIELERLVVEVPESEVDQRVARLAEGMADYAPAPDGTAAVKGNRLEIDFVGRIDGAAFAGGSGENYTLELGRGQFIPGFEDQLLGIKAGESRTLTVTFPDDYGAADLAGKVAEFDVTAKAVMEAQPLAIDDETAKKIGAQDLADLRDQVRRRIAGDYASVSRTKLKRELLDHLADKHDFPVPPGMVAREFESIWSQLTGAKERGEIDDEDKDKSEEALREEYRNIAERRVRLGLLLAEVGRRNELSVSQDELNRAIAGQARYMPGQERQVYAYYQDNPQAMQQLQAPLYEDKVVDFILEMAKVTNRSVSIGTLMGEPAPGEDAPETSPKPKPKTKRAKSTKRKTKSESEQGDV